MTPFDRFLDTANAFLWQNTVLFIILGTGIVWSLWQTRKAVYVHQGES